MKPNNSVEDITRPTESNEDDTRILTSEFEAQPASLPSKKNQFKWTWILTLALIGVALLSLIYMFFFRTDETLSAGGYEEGKLADRPAVPEVSTVDESVLVSEEDPEELVAEDEEEDSVDPDALLEAEGGENSEATPVATDDNRTYDMSEVSQVPMFHGGDQAMYAWLRSNNQLLDDDTAHGKVVVSFIVEKNGTISEVKIVRGRNAKLDSEAARLVNSMPSWTPGSNAGSPVRVKYQLPITF